MTFVSQTIGFHASRSLRVFRPYGLEIMLRDLVRDEDENLAGKNVKVMEVTMKKFLYRWPSKSWRKEKKATPYLIRALSCKLKQVPQHV